MMLNPVWMCCKQTENNAMKLRYAAEYYYYLASPAILTEANEDQHHDQDRTGCIANCFTW